MNLREILTVPIFIYGSVLGLLTALGFARTNTEETKEIEKSEVALEMMVGSQLSAKKNIIIKIVWFSFLMSALYSVSSLYLFFYHPYGRMISIFLIGLEVTEHLMNLKRIKRASTFNKMMSKERFTKISSVLHLIGIAILLGFLI